MRSVIPPLITTDNLGAATRFTIRGPKRVYANAFLFTWMAVWLALEIALVQIALGEFFPAIQSTSNPFAELGLGPISPIWLAIITLSWTIFGYMLWQLFLQVVGGLEVLEVADHGLRIKHKVFGLGSFQTFTAEQVKRVRLVDLEEDAVYGHPAWRDSLVIDLNEKKITFGRGLTPAEADELLRAIFRRYPNYDS